MSNLKIMNQNAGAKWGGEPRSVSAPTMPAGTTTIEDADSHLISFCICNPSTSAGAEVVTITDGSGGFVVNQSLAPGGTVSASFEYGVPMPGGIRWSAASGFSTGKAVWVKPSISL